MSLSLDSLFELMIEKIQEIKILDRFHADNEVYKEVKDEIKLIQKIINLKKEAAVKKTHDSQRNLRTIQLYLLERRDSAAGQKYNRGNPA